MPRQTQASSQDASASLSALRTQPAKAPMPASAEDISNEGGVHLERRGSLQDPDALARQKVIKRIFYTIFICEMVINFDSGAVPAMLDQIKTDLDLKPWEMGMMGGVQYIGLVLMSPIAGMALQKYSSKTVLAIALWGIGLLWMLPMLP